MWKVLLGLLKGGEGRKSVAGGLAWEIREAIKGKELDPEKLIELQTKINLAEASHRTLFVAGWRPFIGWTCGVALCWHFVLAPITIFLCAYIGVAIPELPTFDMGSLMTVLMGMLGLGGLRTYEKQKGLTK